MGVAFTIPGEAVPFARAGRKGSFSFTPKKQSNFMGAVKGYAHDAMRGAGPLDGPLSMTVRAVYLIPPSWSKRKRATAYWKSSKPDADNIAKILKDAMSKVVFADDAQVAELTVTKVYGPTAFVQVTVERLGFRVSAQQASEAA